MVKEEGDSAVKTMKIRENKCVLIVTKNSIFNFSSYFIDALNSQLLFHLCFGVTLMAVRTAVEILFNIRTVYISLVEE